MDFSIFYLVILKPGEVFKQFLSKLRLEPYVFLGVFMLFLIVTQYWGRFEEAAISPMPIILQILISYFLFYILFPVLNTVVVILMTYILMRGKKLQFLSLLSAFILCALPFYIETILTIYFDYIPFNLASLFPGLETSYPFAFGMIASVTFSFLWVVVLWWLVVKQLVLSEKWKQLLIVISLVIVNMILGGLDVPKIIM